MTNTLVRIDRAQIVVALVILAALLLVLQVGLDVQEASAALRTTPWFQN